MLEVRPLSSFKSAELHITIPEKYKEFLDTDGIVPSCLMKNAIEILIMARCNGNDRNINQIIGRKEQSIIRIQESLTRVMTFIEEMGLLNKYGDWLVLNEKKEALKHGSYS